MSREFNPNDIKIDQEIPPFKVKIDHKKYRKYNKLIKEINPIHMSKMYAQKIGYEDIVIAGNFLFTYIPKWIIDWIGDVNVIKKATVKFENPVYPYDEIIHKGSIVDIKERNEKKIIKCDYNVEKISGERTSYGTIVISL